MVLYRKVSDEIISNTKSPGYLFNEIKSQNDFYAKEHERAEVIKKNILEDELLKEKNALDLIDALISDFVIFFI